MTRHINPHQPTRFLNVGNDHRNAIGPSTTLPEFQHSISWALELAERGWRVFPCSPVDKTPMVAKWKEAASNQRSDVLDMFNRMNMVGAMVGVAAGEKSGVWCLDPDAPSDKNPMDGRESWNELQAEHGAAPPTHTHLTPGGGQHLIFAWRGDRAPITNREGALKGKHINVRGEGGYFIAVGSVNADGVAYTMADPALYFQIAPAPDWLHDLIEGKSDATCFADLSAADQALIPNEMRLDKDRTDRPIAEPDQRSIGDRALDRVAQNFQEAGAGAGATNRYAASALDKESAGLAMTFIDRNIRLNNAAISLGRFVKSGELPEAVVIAGLIEASVANGYDKEHGRASTLATIKSGLRAAVARKVEAVAPVTLVPGTSPTPPFEVFWHGINYDRAGRPWLIKTLIPAQGAGLLSGQWGTAKTFVALDLAGAVMTKGLFAGREIDRQGGVLFIAAEGAGEVSIRLEAMASGYQTADTTKLPFAWIEETPDIKNDVSYRKLIEIAVRVRDQIKEKFSLDLVLIIVDTMSAAANWKDHNDAAEGQLVMNRLNELGRATGAFVLAVDHFGKDASTGTRGTSAKEASADVVLATLADRDLNGQLSKTRLAVRKLRGGKTGEEFPFDLNVVPAGFGETTCTIGWRAVQAAGDSGATSEKVRWPKALRVFRTAMQAIVGEKGRSITPYGAEGPTVRAVTLAEVRTEFMAAYPVDEGGERDQKATKRTAFNRAIKDARDWELIASREIGGVDMLWFAKE
jgi:AAA domain/Bifunctional DNA primase/polymerase, N-terminal